MLECPKKRDRTRSVILVPAVEILRLTAEGSGPGGSGGLLKIFLG